MPREAVEDGELFIAEVCWRYFVNGQTQAEVAQAMDVTRLRVNQAIQKAKAMGMVNIQIESPFITRIELQHRLEEALGVQKALVVPADRENYDYHAPIGAALAHHLTALLKSENWRKIGVSWGVALTETIARLPRQSNPDLEILAFMGGATAGSSFNAFSIASGFAEKLGAAYSHLAAPIYLPAAVDRDTFLQQDVYKEHMDNCLAADAVLLVAGDVSDLSYMIKYGIPKDISAESLRQAGAVGDVLGRYLDAEGNELDHPLNRRTAGVDLDHVRRIPNKIMTAAGRHKIRVIHAAIRRGLVDTLVTDDLTAELLLEQ